MGLITVLCIPTGFATHRHQVECIGPVLILTNMKMIVMKAAMEAGMKIGMVMEKREIGVIGMMTGLEELGIHIVVMEIVMAENMMNAMAEKVSGMMITGEEVGVLMNTSMALEVEAPIERESVHMMMMVNIHLGKGLLSFS